MDIQMEDGESIVGKVKAHLIIHIKVVMEDIQRNIKERDLIQKVILNGEIIIITLDLNLKLKK